MAHDFPGASVDATLARLSSALDRMADKLPSPELKTKLEEAQQAVQNYQKQREQ